MNQSLDGQTGKRPPGLYLRPLLTGSTLALSRAQAAIQTKGLNEAAGICRDVLTSAADHPAAIALLGVVSAIQNDLDRGIELLQRAIRLRPGVASWYAHLSSLYRAVAATGSRSDWATQLRIDCGVARTLGTVPPASGLIPQFLHLAAELGRVDWLYVGHRGLLQTKLSDVHGTGATSVQAKRLNIMPCHRLVASKIASRQPLRAAFTWVLA